MLGYNSYHTPCRVLQGWYGKMIERRYENDKKVYVKVAAFFHPDGKLQLNAFWTEDERRYKIDRITDVCRVASLKAGGVGMRYTCMVMGREEFFEEYRWFLEL